MALRARLKTKQKYQAHSIDFFIRSWRKKHRRYINTQFIRVKTMKKINFTRPKSGIFVLR